MEIMYDESNAAVPSDMMALKATDDPMLINERSDTMTRLTQSALSGTVNVGLTFLKHALV
jgi:hypothetical protein